MSWIRNTGCKVPIFLFILGASSLFCVRRTVESLLQEDPRVCGPGPESGLQDRGCRHYTEAGPSGVVIVQKLSYHFFQWDSALIFYFWSSFSSNLNTRKKTSKGQIMLIINTVLIMSLICLLDRISCSSFHRNLDVSSQRRSVIPKIYSFKCGLLFSDWLIRKWCHCFLWISYSFAKKIFIMFSH